MDISQLSRVTGVPVNTLRHYRQMGLLVSNESEDKKLLFDESHIHTVKLIKLATRAGYRLREILKIFETGQTGGDEQLNAFIREIHEKTAAT